MNKGNEAGILAGLSSAIFLGLSPVFGKLAINLGFSPLAVVALRTSLAAGLVFLVVLLFYRRYLYIYPVGLLGCMLAGLINGLGSILFYMSLYRLSVSVGQLLYSLYPFFVALWLVLDRQALSRLTLVRIAMVTCAVLLLTVLPNQLVDPIGVAMMLGAAVFYSLHLLIIQRVLYEVPAPTVTLYTLLSMSAVVVPAFLLFNPQWPSLLLPWWPVIGLTLVTSLSRLTLFLGVKRIGGMQTAILGLGELLVAITFSYLWLHENLLWTQWLGAIGLCLSLLLVKFEKPHARPPHNQNSWLAWIRPPDVSARIPWEPDE